MKVKLFVALLAVAMIATASGTLLADDLNPPPWRGEPRTTYGRWEFNTLDPNPMPDEWYGISIPNTTITPGPGQEWMEGYDDRFGVWPLSGVIEVEIENWPEPLDHKEIWIQLTWQPFDTNGDPTDDMPSIIVDAPGSTQGAFDEWDTTYMLPPFSGNWQHLTFQTFVSPNPEFETIIITGDIVVDELVIDTICIPEPATMGLMGLGLLGLLRRKRA